MTDTRKRSPMANGQKHSPKMSQKVRLSMVRSIPSKNQMYEPQSPFKADGWSEYKLRSFQKIGVIEFLAKVFEFYTNGS